MFQTGRGDRPGWEYSNEAISLIKEFKAKFPEVVAALEENPNGDAYTLEQILPGVADPTDRLKEIVAWLGKVNRRWARVLKLNTWS